MEEIVVDIGELMSAMVGMNERTQTKSLEHCLLFADCSLHCSKTALHLAVPIHYCLLLEVRLLLAVVG